MADEKKGLLSRLGFGRKKAEEEAARRAAEERSRAEAEAARQAEELERKRRIAAEKAEAERVEAERLAREKTEREAEQQRLVEERAAKQRAESERRERERAEEDARKLEAQKAADAKKAEAKRERDEAAARRKAEAEAAAAKAKREEEKRLAAEKAEDERLEAERVAREKAEAARKQEEERVARDKAEAEAAAKAEAARRKAEADAKSKAASPAPEPGSREVAPGRSRPRVKPGDTGSKGQRELSPEMLREASGKAPAPNPEGNIFSRMSRGLKRSSTKLTDNVVGAFSKRLLDDEALEELEDMLIASDLGVRPSLRIVERLQDQRFNTTVDDSEVRAAMSAVVTDTLKPFEAQLKLRHEPGSGELDVVLFTGVNGSGKTTTLGKLAAKFRDAGYTVLIAAGDTFRAAANEQLAVWSERAEAPIMETKQGADAAGLVYDAMTRAKDDGYDVLMIDTAGRLQNRTELMDELSKIVRVIRKQDSTAPHHSLLVLDATVGQNALSQVEVFKDVAGVTGLVMTKLDGTAKGGVLVNLTDKYELPIHFVGIGERLEDLEVFDAEAYAQALSGSVRAQ